MKSKKQLFLSTAGAILFSLCGCNNHLKTLETESLDYKRAPKPQITYRVKTQIQQQSPLMLQFDIAEQKRTMVETYSVRQTIERYTPYQWWRESYEVLMGVCLLPVSLCSHIINVCTFGVFPYHLAATVTDTSFAGMNPFLNVESSTRFVEKPVKSVRKKIDSKMEFISYPAANVPVEVKSESGSLRTMTKDNGVAKLNILNTKGWGPTLEGNRELKIYVAGSSTPCDTIIIDRITQRLIWNAARKLQAYHRAPSGRSLYSLIVEMEKLKMADLAFRLEKEEFAKNKNNDKFIKEFNKMMENEK